MNKVSAVYKIVNTITGDCYVGSSKNVMHRLSKHKCPSTWKECPDKQLYKDMQKYGVDKFRFQILAPVMPEYLKQVEQELIEVIHPTYNDRRANGFDVERRKEYKKKYRHSNKGKEVQIKSRKNYKNQTCYYNGETLTLNALVKRFLRAGIEHATLEAKKYILDK